MYDLLKDAQYFEVFDEITEENIYDVLKESPIDIIGDWMLLSEDKRTNEGWAFGEKKEGGYSVAYVSLGKVLKELTFTDQKLACAAFIKREIETIRTI